MRARGQSSVDFVLGFGVFFLTFSFVVTLLPELLAPHAAQQGPAVADRAVDTLTGDLLAGDAVGTLDASCTAAFLTRGTCAEFDGSDPTARLLGVSDEYQLNVTLERYVAGDAGTELACYDGGVVDCATGGTPLARGPAPPSNTQSVRTASRVVRVDGETLSLELRVW
ncbi:DUF7287 family protein [Halorarius halobius]|uniref:DUF7287 family protein n=1 Tax=Halorarius halobius TaxID=2962671 RepID=UPI0020CFCED6|nr:hypothetical protein [Halorarius halobius]